MSEVFALSRRRSTPGIHFPLLLLPDQLLGIIYAHLPDRQSRWAFSACCKTVHSSDSVLSRIRRLSVAGFEIRAHHEGLCDNPLSTFPRGAQLQSLKLCGLQTTSGGDERWHQLRELLQPADAHVCSRVERTLSSVTGLLLSGENTGLMIGDPQHAAQFGKMLQYLCPNLSSVKIGSGDLPGVFWEGLAELRSSDDGRIELLNLSHRFDRVDANYIHAIGMHTSLRSLDIYPGYDESPHRSTPRTLSVAPLASLVWLQSLTIAANESVPVSDLQLVLPCLQHLQKLSLSTLTEDQAECLPSSLLSIQLNSSQATEFPAVLASSARRSPVLAEFEIHELGFYKQEAQASCLLGTALAECLATLRNRQLTVVVYLLDCWWGHLEAPMSFFQPVKGSPLAAGIKDLQILDPAGELNAHFTEEAARIWPNISSIQFSGKNVQYDRQLQSLKAAMVFLNLTHLTLYYSPIQHPNFAVSCLGVCAAALAAQPMRVDDLRIIVFAQINDGFYDDDEDEVLVQKIKREHAAVEEAWKAVNLRLESVHCVAPKVMLLCL